MELLFPALLKLHLPRTTLFYFIEIPRYHDSLHVSCRGVWHMIEILMDETSALSSQQS